jgi:hypothetical protein
MSQASKRFRADPAERRGNLTIRMRADLREKKESEAAANGRSLSEEIEHTCERDSYEKEIVSRVYQETLGSQLGVVWHAIGNALYKVSAVAETVSPSGARPGAAALSNPYVSRQIAETLREFADALDPSKDDVAKAAPQLIADPATTALADLVLAHLPRDTARQALKTLIDTKELGPEVVGRITSYLKRGES